MINRKKMLTQQRLQLPNQNETTSIKATDIIHNQYQPEHHINILNIQHSQQFQYIKDCKRSQNKYFTEKLRMTIPLTLTREETEILLNLFLNADKLNEIEEKYIEKPSRFIISEGLDVVKLQTFQLQQLLNQENQEILQVTTTPQTQKLINEYIPTGPPLQEIPVKKIGSDSFIDFNHLFDMEVVRETIQNKLELLVKEKKISPEEIKFCGNYDGKYTAHIRINTKKLLLATHTFQIKQEMQPRESNRSHYFNMYQMEQKEELSPILQHAHQMTIKIFAVPAVVIDNLKYRAIISQTTKQKRNLVAYNIAMQALKQMNIKVNPSIISTFDIEFNTNYPMKQVMYNPLSLKINIRGTGIDSKVTLRIPQQQQIKYKQFKRRIQNYKFEVLREYNAKIMEAKQINNTYGNEAINKLEQRLKKKAKESDPQDDMKLYTQMVQDLQQRKQQQIIKLNQLTELKRQARNLKSEINKLQRFDDDISLRYSPLMVQTYHVPASPVQQANMLFVSILLSKNGFYRRLGINHCEPRPSIQAANIDQLMIMDFSNGVIQYKFNPMNHRNAKDMKLLINEIQRKYLKTKFKQEKMRQMQNVNNEFEFTIIDVIRYCTGLIKFNVAIPINYKTTNSNEYKLKEIDTNKSLIIMDRKNKMVYIDNEQDKTDYTNILYTLNSVKKITKLEKKFHGMTIDEDEQEEEEEEEIDKTLTLSDCVYEKKFVEKENWTIKTLTNDQTRVIKRNYDSTKFEGPVTKIEKKDITECCVQIKKYQKFIEKNIETVRYMDKQQRKKIIKYSNTEFQDVLTAMRGKNSIIFERTALADKNKSTIKNDNEYYDIDDYEDEESSSNSDI